MICLRSVLAPLLLHRPTGVQVYSYVLRCATIMVIQCEPMTATAYGLRHAGRDQPERRSRERVLLPRGTGRERRSCMQPRVRDPQGPRSPGGHSRRRVRSAVSSRGELEGDDSYEVLPHLCAAVASTMEAAELGGVCARTPGTCHSRLAVSSSPLSALGT